MYVYRSLLFRYLSVEIMDFLSFYRRSFIYSYVIHIYICIYIQKICFNFQILNDFSYNSINFQIYLLLTYFTTFYLDYYIMVSSSLYLINMLITIYFHYMLLYSKFSIKRCRAVWVSDSVCPVIWYFFAFPLLVWLFRITKILEILVSRVLKSRRFWQL